MYNAPLYVRYGLKHWIELLWDYCVSEAFKSVYTVFYACRHAGDTVLPRPVYPSSSNLVQPAGKPISFSTQSGFS